MSVWSSWDIGWYRPDESLQQIRCAVTGRNDLYVVAEDVADHYGVPLDALLARADDDQCLITFESDSSPKHLMYIRDAHHVCASLRTPRLEEIRYFTV